MKIELKKQKRKKKDDKLVDVDAGERVCVRGGRTLPRSASVLVHTTAASSESLRASLEVGGGRRCYFLSLTLVAPNGVTDTD